MLNEEFLFQVYVIVLEIPHGKVLTYGDIASLIGFDKNSRLVGRALKMAGIYGDYPCHRVVNHQGRLTPGWIEQKELLKKEGVVFKENGYVDLKVSRWEM